MKRSVLLLTGVLVAGLLFAPTVVLAAEDPRFETEVPEPTVTPGETTVVAVEITNDAEDIDDDVETATDVRATMREGDTPFSVLSGTKRLGTLRDGQPVVGEFTIRAPQNIAAGTYHVPIDLDYVYDGDEEESTTVTAEVRVEDRARFSVTDSAADLTVGEDGSVSLTMVNDGSETASEASVQLTSETGNVAFGTAASTAAFVGNWTPGEEKTVTVEANAPATADPGTYSLTAAVEYENSDGFARTSSPMSVGLPVDPETDQFSRSGVEHSLRVGEEGTLSMTVTNEGEAVTDAVVRLSGTGMNVHPLATEYAIGNLDSGASAAVDFPIEVSESAEATPRQFSVTVAYDDSEGDARTSDPLSVRAVLEPERDRFLVTPINATLEAGGSGTITAEVTNNGDSTVQDVNAKVFTNDPLASGDDEAYVDELEPGETTQIAFGLSASGAAIQKQYPISMDFQYDAQGDTKLSKTYQVPISVVEPDDSGIPPWAIGAVVLVVVVAALLVYRRR